MKSNGVPGPGAYNVPSSFGGPQAGRAAVILPLTPRELYQLELAHETKDEDGNTTTNVSPSADAGVSPGSKSNSVPRDRLPIIKQWQIPPLGTYNLEPTWGVSQKMQIHGTPRSERTLFNVDLGQRSRMPGPGQYNLAVVNTMAGRDRTYRTRLPLERINVMAPVVSPRKRRPSPRREE
jgi:hypothetical protein